MSKAFIDPSPAQIPNIDIGQAYDQRYVDRDLHFESFERLAEFFGRNMPIHHHDRFYQIHVILAGEVHVHLDETSYSATGPLFFLTPPSVPHAFVTNQQAHGYVITARQQLVWQLVAELFPTETGFDSFLNSPVCAQLEPDSEPTAQRLLTLLELIAQESAQTTPQGFVAQKSLLQVVLLQISRLAERQQPQQKTKKEDIRIFHRFNELIEQKFREHLSLREYAQMINVTEARLNEVCRRLAGLPSKRLVMDRLMQEAKRLLLFSAANVTEISYQLGFKDPAYFARFFKRNAGMTAGQFRDRQQ